MEPNNCPFGTAWSRGEVLVSVLSESFKIAFFSSSVLNAFSFFFSFYSLGSNFKDTHGL